MLIDKNTIAISPDNRNWVVLGEYLIKCKYGHHKLWGDDTGRTQSGKYVGTFKGNYPKLTLQFKKLNKDEFDIIAPLISKPYLFVQYYNPEYKALAKMYCYTGDWESEIERMGCAKGVQISLISTERA